MTSRRSSRMLHPLDPREHPDPRRSGILASTDEVEPQQDTRQQQHQRRPRGILAFLPAEGDQYPYHEDYWKKKKMGANGGVAGVETSSRTMTKRSRRRRQAEQLSFSESADGESSRTTVSLVDWFHDANDGDPSSADACSEWRSEAAPRLLSHAPPTLLVLFCFDPGQPYSCTVRNRLLSLCEGAARSKGVGVGGADDSSLRLRCVAISAQHRSPQASDFLRDTGFVAVPWSSQLATLGIVPPHTPSLAVYRNQKRISCSHEELGLEWNSTDRVLVRWRNGQSSLSCSQQALASAVFPTSCAVL
jgi:hypothetical protein